MKNTKRDYAKLHLNDLLTLVQNGEKGANLEIKERIRATKAQFDHLVLAYDYQCELFDHVNTFICDSDLAEQLERWSKLSGEHYPEILIDRDEDEEKTMTIKLVRDRKDRIVPSQDPRDKTYVDEFKQDINIDGILYENVEVIVAGGRVDEAHIIHPKMSLDKKHSLEAWFNETYGYGEYPNQGQEIEVKLLDF